MMNNWFSETKEFLKTKWRYLNRVFLSRGLREKVPHLVRGFTLLELLITVAIIMIVATAVLMVMNPFETLSQARDGRRISEVASIDEAITLALQQSPAIFEGSPNIIYLSLPDIGEMLSTGYLNNCTDYPSLPPLVSPWRYNCAPQESLFQTGGTGWLPFNFNSLAIRPLATLPIDPVNDAKKGLYYAYVQGWEIDVQMESKKYGWGGADDRESIDGGNTIILYEKGPNLNAAPKEVNARITYEIKDSCSVDSPAAGNFAIFYPRWNIPKTSPAPSSGKVVVTKLMFYDFYGTLSSLEQVRMAIYNGGNPNYGKISGEATMIGTGVSGWVSSTLDSPVPITLGTSYLFGMLGEAVGGGLASFSVPRDNVPICSEHPTVPNMGFWTGNNGVLSPVAAGSALSFPTGFSGISYSTN